MAKYRKKPVVVDAMVFDGGFASTSGVLEFCEGNAEAEFISGHGPCLLKIKTLEGTMRASIGDYIIKGVNGEFYPCKPDIFEKTYELIGGEIE